MACAVSALNLRLPCSAPKILVITSRITRSSEPLANPRDRASIIATSVGPCSLIAHNHDEPGPALTLQHLALDLGWSLRKAQNAWRQGEALGIFRRDPNCSDRLYLSGLVPRFGSSPSSLLSVKSLQQRSCTQPCPALAPDHVQKQLAALEPYRGSIADAWRLLANCRKKDPHCTPAQIAEVLQASHAQIVGRDHPLLWTVILVPRFFEGGYQPCGDPRRKRTEAELRPRPPFETQRGWI